MNKDTALASAQKYNQRSIFAQQDPSNYRWLIRNKLIDTACKHMIQTKLDKESAFKIAKQYKYRGELLKNNKTCYKYLQSNGFLDEACRHMLVKDRGMKWNKGSAFKVAKRCKSVAELKNHHFSCYKWLKQNELIQLACSHMSLKKIWNKKSAFKEAKQHSSRTQLMRNNAGCYKWLARNNLLGEACSHMEQIVTIWNKDAAFKVTKQFTKSSDLMREQSGCYYWLLRNKLMDEAGAHFESSQNLREKMASDLFLKKLQEFNYKIQTEYFIYSDNKKCFLDFYIEIPERKICFAIEFKHDESNWTVQHLEKQIKKYNHAFKNNSKFVGTFLVSPKGKHGFSEKQFFFILKNLEQKDEILLPNYLVYLKSKKI